MKYVQHIFYFFLCVVLKVDILTGYHEKKWIIVILIFLSKTAINLTLIFLISYNEYRIYGTPYGLINSLLLN